MPGVVIMELSAGLGPLDLASAAVGHTACLAVRERLVCTRCRVIVIHYLRPLRLLLPALLIAIATACFCGRPACISVRMLLLMVAFDEPRRSGMTLLPRCLTTSSISQLRRKRNTLHAQA